MRLKNIKLTNICYYCGLISAPVFWAWAYFARDVNILELEAGFLALLAILVLAQEYFFLPKQSEGSIGVPDPDKYKCSGILGLLSSFIVMVKAIIAIVLK